MKSNLQEFETLIQKNQLKDVFDLLKKRLDGDQRSIDLMALYASYNDVERKGKLNTISFEQENLIHNKVRYSLLELVNSIKETPHIPLQVKTTTDATLSKSKTISDNQKMFIGIGLLLVLLVLFFLFKPNSVTGIQGDNNDGNEIHINE